MEVKTATEYQHEQVQTYCDGYSMVSELVGIACSHISQPDNVDKLVTLVEKIEGAINFAVEDNRYLAGTLLGRAISPDQAKTITVVGGSWHGRGWHQARRLNFWKFVNDPVNVSTGATGGLQWLMDLMASMVDMILACWNLKSPRKVMMTPRH